MTEMARWVDGRLTQSMKAELPSDMPAHLRESMETNNQIAGQQALAAVIRPARLKVIQALKADAKYRSFNAGDTVLIPEGRLLVEKGVPFYFVPLLMFREYLVVNPLKTKNTLPFIRDRSLDPNSEIAVICRSPELRNSRPCPEMPQEFLKYKEVLNFIVVLAGEVMQPCVMSFSGGELRTGTVLASLLLKRGTHWYGTVFEACVPNEERVNSSGNTWWGWNIINPTSEGNPGPWVKNPEEFVSLKALSDRLHSELSAGRVQVDLDEEETAVNDARF